MQEILRTDVLSESQRSSCMSKIRGKDTKPEMSLRRALWGVGLRYRLKNKYKLPGRPDIIFPRKKVVVYVDGCFWHRCPLHFQAPTGNKDFWKNKIDGNVERDRRYNEIILAMGWTVLRVWEHEIKGDLLGVVRRIDKVLGD